MRTLKKLVRQMLPKDVFVALQNFYHYTLAWSGAVRFGHPSRKLKVIGVTGTKGKSTTVELIHAILDEAGYHTASAGTIRFIIGDTVERNLFKMTMPGRFFLQSFLRRAVDSGCQYAVIEMTSEGARQYRHIGIALDALVFTNLSPEHIESHGSFENYLAAKLRLRDSLEVSPKSPKYMVANRDDARGATFLSVTHAKQVPYSLKDAEPYALNERGILFTFEGTTIHSPLTGIFNLYNLLGAATVARTQGVPPEVIKRALEKKSLIRGRVEKIEEGQKFSVIVDYAHTPDSLEKLYQAFPNRTLIGVLGNTGGGRDTWKRPQMGAIAEKYCKHVILTNEDPYDEDPESILLQMARGMEKKEPKIILDRREAIRTALSLAGDRDVVLISGKGTDPYIMGPNGTMTPWDDATVVREELRALQTVPGV